METDDKRRCSKCNSSQTYIKFTTNERLCRSCGNIEKIKENKND